MNTIFNNVWKSKEYLIKGMGGWIIRQLLFQTLRQEDEKTQAQ